MVLVVWIVEYLWEKFWIVVEFDDFCVVIVVVL